MIASRTASEMIASMAAADTEGGEVFEEGSPVQIRHDELLEQILALKPTTAEGHQMRARAVLEWQGGVGANGKPASVLSDCGFWPVIRDLIGQDTIDAMAKRTAELCATYPEDSPK